MHGPGNIPKCKRGEIRLKKTGKWLVTVLFVLSMLTVLLTGCNRNNDGNTDGSTTTTKTTTTTTTTTTTMGSATTTTDGSILDGDM